MGVYIRRIQTVLAGVSKVLVHVSKFCIDVIILLQLLFLLLLCLILPFASVEMSIKYTPSNSVPSRRSNLKKVGVSSMSTSWAENLSTTPSWADDLPEPTPRPRYGGRMAIVSTPKHLKEAGLEVDGGFDDEEPQTDEGNVDDGAVPDEPCTFAKSYEVINEFHPIPKEEQGKYNVVRNKEVAVDEDSGNTYVYNQQIVDVDEDGDDTLNVFNEYFCCPLKCMQIFTQVDGMACQKCANFGYCACNCRTWRTRNASIPVLPVSKYNADYELIQTNQLLLRRLTKEQKMRKIDWNSNMIDYLKADLEDILGDYVFFCRCPVKVNMSGRFRARICKSPHPKQYDGLIPVCLYTSNN